VELAHNLLATRRGTIIVGVVAAALAFVLLIAYLGRYRSSVGESTAGTPVLVARTLIPKGTSGDVVGSARRFEVSSLPASSVKEGALVDPAALSGRVALSDIYPGQQITAADFTVPAAGAIVPKLTGSERGVALPFGQGALAADVQAGDHVDVFLLLDLDRGGVTQRVIKFVSDDLKVLRAPDAQGGTIVVRTRGDEAARLLLAADQGKLVYVVRPGSDDAKQLPVNILGMDAVIDHKPVVGGRP
jgi:Flp pilus assembly protein CpaB